MQVESLVSCLCWKRIISFLTLMQYQRTKLEKAKLMFLNYPNNPTSAIADKKFFEEVVQFAKDNDIVVIHDNAYSEMTYDGYQAPSFLRVDGAMDVGIELYSLSKTYNMTGWRLAFAVGNKDIIAGVGKVKSNVDSGAFDAIQMGRYHCTFQFTAVCC